MKIIFFLLTLLLHGSCSSGNSSDTTDITPKEYPSPKKLNWIGQWRGENMKEELVRDIAKSFSFVYQNIDLNMKFPEELTGEGQKDPRAMANLIVSMIKSGDYLWDVIWLDDLIYYLVSQKLNDPQWGKKYLVDFNTVPGFPETQKEFIINGKDYRNKYGGILAGPYVEGFLFLIWFNRDVAKAMGIDIKERGVSVKEFIGYLKKADDYNRKSRTNITILMETKDYNTVNILFQNMIISSIGYINAMRDNLTNRKREILLKTFEVFEEMGKYSPLNKDYKELSFFETREWPLLNKVLFYVNDSGMYSQWSSIDKEKTSKMIPMELPGFNGINDSSLGGYSTTWAVFKEAPNKAEGITLLKYISSSKIAEKWTRYTKAPTGLKGNLFNIAFLQELDIWTRFHADMYHKFGTKIKFSTDTKYLLGEANAGMKALIEKQLISLITGQTTAENAYSVIMESIR